MHPHRMLKAVLTPSVGGAALYVLISAVILIGSTASSLLDRVTLPENRYYFAKLFHAYASAAFGRLNGLEALGRLTLFLLWAGVGAVLYVVVWLVINWYIALHNDVVVGTTYTTIDQHGRARYWGELAARGLFRGCAMLLMLLAVTAIMQVWYPLSITMFSIWASDFTVPFSWALLTEAFAGWFLALHVLVVFLRLIYLRTRLFA